MYDVYGTVEELTLFTDAMLQRLGLAYHFEVEIDAELIKCMNDKYHELCGVKSMIDLHTVALCFRLLRQHGYSERYIIEELIENKLDGFIIPLLQGNILNNFIFNGKLKLKRLPATVTLISRRSTRRLGTRMWRRGANLQGDAANFIETEQFMEFDGFISSGIIMSKYGSSDVRGSIPLLWEQIVDLSYKPRLNIISHEETLLGRKREMSCKNPNRQMPEKIIDHDRLIWLGDLNYRVSLSYEEASTLLEDNDWDSLLQKDQLNIEREAGRIPMLDGETCKSKKKRRTPAWCDRKLWRGSGIEQLSYIRGESRFSDHRPVCAVFSVEVELKNNKAGKFRKGNSCTVARMDVEDGIPHRHNYYGY
ncbi:hypothetical protein POM88_039864 [Heracleum sosnowskyi]|uniref:phosphoinositide 5-phosphatase n=1 Tax=Heracleum sosnowskyi TaxID=360622 RepID=A0AAD8HDM3_9APIA|nr:hypothetical protein POM88_039864 [Heracleum sosnowskyi]